MKEKRAAVPVGVARLGRMKFLVITSASMQIRVRLEVLIGSSSAPEPQDGRKLFVDFFFSHHVEQKEGGEGEGETSHYLAAGLDSIPTSEYSPRCGRVKALSRLDVSSTFRQR